MSYLKRVKLIASNHDYFTADDLESEEFGELLEDYEEVKDPNTEIRKYAKDAVTQCLGDLPFWKRVALYYSDSIERSLLGKLRSETESRPIIILSPKNILSAAKKYNVSVEDTVKTTVYHEFGHAVVALADIEDYDLDYTDEEDFVEAYAHGLWTGNGSVAEDEFFKFLEAFE